MFTHLKQLFITIFVSAAVAFFIGFFVARAQFAPTPMSSETILRAMQQESFFVTQSILLDESITIDNRSGNALRDFFVSEQIIASARVNVALGFDTTELTSDDIRFEGNTIFMTVPNLSIFSTEVLGDVTIDTNRGIISRIISGQDDYNGLVALLKEQARTTILDTDIMADAQKSTIDSLTQFIQFIAPTYTTVVTFK
jgi:hypothetical protein